MTTRNNRTKDYQKELQGRIHIYLGEYPFNNAHRAFPSEEELYEFVKEIALESYKNGVAVGRKQKGAPQRHQGSALQNGKLRPVH